MAPARPIHTHEGEAGPRRNRPPGVEPTNSATDPLYVLVVGLMLHRLVQSGFHDVGWIITPALHDIFFVQSYLPGTYGHFWSLAVEEHFYILLPLMLYFMIRKARAGETDPFRKLPLIFLLVAIFSVSARLVHAVMVQPYSYFTHLFPTHFRLDSLLFGVLLSYWYRFHSDKFNASIKRTRPFLFPLSFLLILPVIILDGSSFIIYTVGLSSLYLGYGCLGSVAEFVGSTPGGRFLRGPASPS